MVNGVVNGVANGVRRVDGTMTTKTKDLWKAIERHLAAERLELDDLELTGRGKGRTLRVVVDAEGGIDIDRLAAVSQDLSRLLDVEGDIEGPYRLEVTSPGLERRLRRPRHYEKSVGREVVVKRPGAETLRGVLVEADETGIAVEVDGEVRRVGYEEIESARTVFRWQRAPKPGK